MVDPDATPPDGIPPEPDTKPDLATFPCPFCLGEDGKPTGLVLEVSEWATQHRAIAHKCSECRGSKVVNRQQFAKFQAQRQGRNR